MISLVKLFESKDLLLEYSEKIIKQLIDRYKSQNRNLDEQNIRYYIERFDQLKNSIRQRFEAKDENIVKAIPKFIQDKNKYLDILQWQKFTDLEKIIDLFPAPKSAQKKAAEELANTATTDADKIYEKDGIGIYKGDEQHKCVKYGSKNGKPEHYSWCISRAGESRSMYMSYRFMQGSSRMFYFVFDRSKPDSDNFHAFVIHVFERGTYAVTNATNNGDRSSATWEGLGEFIPKDTWNKIKGLKSLFKFINPSDEEVELQVFSGKLLTLEQFRQLSYNTKVRYVQTNAVSVSKEIFMSLDVDLKNLAINNGRKCSFDEIKMNAGLVKRYPDYRFSRFPDEPLPAVFIPYLKDELKQLYYDKYNEKHLTAEYIEKYLGEKYLIQYIDKDAKKFGYIPVNYIKYISDNKMKKFYETYSKLYQNWKYSPGTMDNNKVDESTTMPRQSIDPKPMFYDQWKRLSNEEKQLIVKWAELADTNIEKYQFLGYSVPFIIKTASQTLILLPLNSENDEYPKWVFSDIQGNVVGNVISGEGTFLGEDSELNMGYPTGDDFRRVWDIKELKVNGKSLKLNEIIKQQQNFQHIMKVRAGLIK